MARINNEAARQLRQQRTRQGSHRTASIVANRETFCLVTWTAAFALLLLAVPTVMAVAKQFGWW